MWPEWLGWELGSSRVGSGQVRSDQAKPLKGLKAGRHIGKWGSEVGRMIDGLNCPAFGPCGRLGIRIRNGGGFWTFSTPVPHGSEVDGYLYM